MPSLSFPGNPSPEADILMAFDYSPSALDYSPPGSVNVECKHVKYSLLNVLLLCTGLQEESFYLAYFPSFLFISLIFLSSFPKIIHGVFQLPVSICTVFYVLYFYFFSYFMTMNLDSTHLVPCLLQCCVNCI